MSSTADKEELPGKTAVLPGSSSLSAVELTNWTDQVLKKRLQNVSGVGAVNLVGGTLREINIYLNPQACGLR